MEAPSGISGDFVDPGLEARGIVPLITNTLTLSAQLSELLDDTAGMFVPWFSIVASPLIIYETAVDVRARALLARAADKTSEAAFWITRLAGCAVGALGAIIKPFVGSLALSGFRHSNTSFLIFSRIFPVIMLVASTVSLVGTSWSAGRTISDYKKMRTEITAQNVREFLNQERSDTERARFKCSFKTLCQDFDRMSDENAVKALVWGGRYSLYDHTHLITTAIMCISAAALMLVSPHYHVISGSLIIGSAGLGIIRFGIKNILIEKIKDMVQSDPCQISAHLSASSTSPAS